MMEEALATDRLLTMVVMRRGWEPQYEATPKLHESGCVGRVIMHDHLPDGRFNLLLQGLCRVRLSEELDPRRGFRRARVLPICDQVPNAAVSAELKNGLLKLFGCWLQRTGEDSQAARALVSDQLDLTRLTDAISYVVDLSVEWKVRLLGEPCVQRRAELLTSYLTRLLGNPRPCSSIDQASLNLLSAKEPNPSDESGRFPPPFSSN